MLLLKKSAKRRPEKSGRQLKSIFKTVSYITDAPQVNAGVLLQIQLAPDGLHVMADQLTGLPIVRFPPDPLIDLAVR